MAKKIHAKTKAAVKKMRAGGATYEQISKRFKLANSTISAIVNDDIERANEALKRARRGGSTKWLVITEVMEGDGDVQDHVCKFNDEAKALSYVADMRLNGAGEVALYKATELAYDLTAAIRRE